MNDRAELVLKKTDLNAKNIYQYHMLANLKHGFLPYDYEETKDELVIRYDRSGLIPVRDFRTASYKVRYKILIDLLDLIEENPNICFPLAPGNIYITNTSQVKILQRDINQESNSKRCLEWKSLAGFLLQKKYSFEDYWEGGESLFGKDRLTAFLEKEKDWGGLLAALKKSYREEEDRERLTMRMVSRKKFLFLQILLVLLLMGTVSFGGLYIRQNFGLLRLQEKALTAQRAYIEMEYGKVIDALQEIPTERMDKHEKYILALSYIKGQRVDAFSPEIRDMLIDRMSYLEEDRMDYWIDLGRMDADAAIDIAQRLSDNQLLLYAYIQKMEILSADSSIRGDEKYQQIENIRGKIRSLADTLGIEYKTEGSASQSETKQPEAVEDGESTGREQIEFHIE